LITSNFVLCWLAGDVDSAAVLVDDSVVACANDTSVAPAKNTVVVHANATIHHRFSTLKFRKVVKSFSDTQVAFIHKYKLGHLLNVPEHLMIPSSLLQWLARHVCHGGSGVFSHTTGTISFNKDMVDKIFGFTSGNVPFITESDDPVVIDEVDRLRRFYVKGNNIPVKHLQDILVGTSNEVVFIRSFVMFFITTILCPCTYNFVNAKYLYSLTDSKLENVKNLDFGSLCLTHLFEEIDSWADKTSKDSGTSSKTTWIGGCLPVLAV
jgi:hypothetical protein